MLGPILIVTILTDVHAIILAQCSGTHCQMPVLFLFKKTLTEQDTNPTGPPSEVWANISNNILEVNY